MAKPKFDPAKHYEVTLTREIVMQGSPYPAFISFMADGKLTQAFFDAGILGEGSREVNADTDMPRARVARPGNVIPASAEYFDESEKPRIQRKRDLLLERKLV